MAYTFDVEWSAGKLHCIADALSRAPFFPADTDLDIDVCASIDEDDPALHTIINNIDEEYARLRDCVRRDILSTDLNAYSSIFGGLRVESNLIVYGTRLVIPRPARPKILELLHASHSSMSKTCELAKQLYIWPNMPNEIRTKIAGCSECVKCLPSLTKEPIKQEVAAYPMEKVSADLFEVDGCHFLLMIDRYSGYPFVSRLHQLSTATICRILLGWFQCVGFPVYFKSDNGPQFRQQFYQFCLLHNIGHDSSSPYNPRSNGLAEAAVKSIKNLLKKVHFR